jgi:hypothetical protein
MRRAAALAALLLCTLPALASAATVTVPSNATPPPIGANPFGPLPESSTPTDTTTVATPVSSTSSSSGLSGTQKTALLIGGAVVIVVVGYLILRDARRRAPVRHARVRAAAAPPPMAPRPGARGLHTGRGKGKAAGKKRRR